MTLFIGLPHFTVAYCSRDILLCCAMAWVDNICRHRTLSFEGCLYTRQKAGVAGSVAQTELETEVHAKVDPRLESFVSTGVVLEPLDTL